jgi:hypothetical protein
LPILIFIVALNSVFLVEVLPKAISKIKSTAFKNKSIFVISLITIILLTNFGFSYKLTYDSLNGIPYEGFENTIQQFLIEPFPAKKSNDMLEISKILSLESDIENSYVMGKHSSTPVAYYSGSKFVLTEFTEGNENDSIDSFILRENWSDYEIYFSNNKSRPLDRTDHNNPIPDYLIYSPSVDSDPIWNTNPRNPVVEILSNPSNPDIPSHFEVIFYSNSTGIVLYKIHHNYEN